jgi:hypothetical protein
VTRGRWARYANALGIVFATALILVPSALGIAASFGAGDWRRHPTFDGAAYRLGAGDVVAAERDPSGSAAVIATFDRWAGGALDEAAAWARLAAAGGGESGFAVVAADLAEGGRWFVTDAATLTHLQVPFVAWHRDGRLLIVRRIESGFVYAADPVRGATLTPFARFVADWSGRLFAFTTPPIDPGPWP